MQGMDEFILSINPDKFRSTNAAWNYLKLNDPWSVGYVTSLIEATTFGSKEEWETYYYQSGAKRNSLLVGLKVNIVDILQDEQLILKDPKQIDALTWNLKSINTQNGRTFQDLVKKGHILFEYLQKQNNNITLNECVECIRFRVICETWNGVVIREKNTIETLKKLFPDVIFKKTTGEVDHRFAVDYELFKGDNLWSAIQIKPKSYLGNASYLEKARAANRQKNSSYTAINKIPVFDIISDTKGNIISGLELFKNLK